MKFYKAIEKTDTFSKYGDELNPENAVAFYMTNTERKEIRGATVQEIVKEIVKGTRDSSEWDADLVPALCTFANMEAIVWSSTLSVFVFLRLRLFL